MDLRLGDSLVGGGPGSGSSRWFTLRWMVGLIPAGHRDGFRGPREGAGRGRAEELAGRFAISSRSSAGGGQARARIRRPQLLIGAAALMPPGELGF